MDMELDGKVAVVTGGSLGIGKAVARELAKEGARVVICARRPGPLQDAASELETGDRQQSSRRDRRHHEGRPGDQPVRCHDVPARESRYPGKQCRRSGRAAAGALEESSEELLSEDLDTKVVGYFRTAQAVAPHMKRQGWGRIVNIGGMSGRYAGVISGVRNAAVAHLTKTLSGQLAPLRDHGQHSPPGHGSHGTDRLRLRSRGRRQGHP